MMNLNTSNNNSSRNTFGLLFNVVTGEKYMVSANKEVSMFPNIIIWLF